MVTKPDVRYLQSEIFSINLHINSYSIVAQTIHLVGLGNQEVSVKSQIEV